MANPLQMLKLKTTALQFIQEVPINAAPKKVWSPILKPSAWFYFNPDKTTRAKHTLELRPGGQWTSQYKDGTAMLLGTVTYFEPGKLLRLAGPMGMTHLPANNVFIFELQPSSDGKKTTLRVGTRLFGFLHSDVKKHVPEAWKMLLGQLKSAAEG